MKYGYFLILLIATCLSPSRLLYAQDSKQLHIDSLLVKLGKAKEDTNKVKLYAALLNSHVYYKGEEGLKYVAPALELANKLNWQRGVLMVKSQTGKIYWKLGKFDEALKWHFEALEIAESSGNHKEVIDALTYVGQDYADNAN